MVVQLRLKNAVKSKAQRARNRLGTRRFSYSSISITSKVRFFLNLWQFVLNSKQDRPTMPSISFQNSDRSTPLGNGSFLAASIYPCDFALILLYQLCLLQNNRPRKILVCPPFRSRLPSPLPTSLPALRVMVPWCTQHPALFARSRRTRHTFLPATFRIP